MTLSKLTLLIFRIQNGDPSDVQNYIVIPDGAPLQPSWPGAYAQPNMAVHITHLDPAWECPLEKVALYSSLSSFHAQFVSLLGLSQYFDLA
jgi:hypothetical protein